MQVKDYMHTHVTTVTPETLVSTAEQLMTKRGSKIRHLPVVTGQNTLVGVLTDRDMRRAEASDAPPMAEHELTYLLDKLCVQDIMTQDVVTVRGTTPIVEAGQIFLQKKFGCLPVVGDDNTLEGIITDRDIREASPSPATTLTRGEIAYQMATIPSKHCMTKDVVSIGPDMDMVQATRLLLQRHYGCLPVVDRGALVGIITEIDCLWAFLDSVDGS